MSQIRNFIQWLSFHPSSDDIARSLATDYLQEFSVASIRFSRLQADGSINTLGSFGSEDSSILPDKDSEIDRVLKGESQEKWCDGSTVYIEVLRDHGVTQGHLTVAFRKAIDSGDKDRVAEIIQDLCVPLSLYLSFQTRVPVSKISPISTIDDSRDAGADQLTQRQILILRGMVEGKTNHELATEMGYSVSTIRHETMRIYQALAVNDRKEAAKKALMLSLI
jgi:DNA-binding CsgD family transcriptional regulator